MKHTYQLIHPEQIQDILFVKQVTESICAVLDDVPVPLFAHKSAKQKGLDLMHSLLNAEIGYWAQVLGWEIEPRLSTLLNDPQGSASRLDFAFRAPSGRWVGVEVQFGNGGRTGEDFSKLRVLHERGQLELGVVVYLKRRTCITADQGLAHYEKALAQTQHYRGLPLLLMGLDREGSETVDVSVIPELRFPSLLGGRGPNNLKLKQFVAKAIVERDDLTQLAWPEDLRAILQVNTWLMADKALAELDHCLALVVAGNDPALRSGLKDRLVQRLATLDA